jgi:hypothetical protein
MVQSVPDRLHHAAALFEERNRQYGDNYKNIGTVMHAMYPDGLTVNTPEEWTRLMLQVHRVTKETRYASNFGRGGHADSLADLSVYAQMAAETDELAAEGAKPYPCTSEQAFDRAGPPAPRAESVAVHMLAGVRTHAEIERAARSVLGLPEDQAPF